MLSKNFISPEYPEIIAFRHILNISWTLDKKFYWTKHICVYIYVYYSNFYEINFSSIFMWYTDEFKYIWVWFFFLISAFLFVCPTVLRSYYARSHVFLLQYRFVSGKLMPIQEIHFPEIFTFKRSSVTNYY